MRRSVSRRTPGRAPTCRSRRGGCSAGAAPRRCTVERLTPAASASERQLQRTAPSGVSRRTACARAWTYCAVSGGFRPRTGCPAPPAGSLSARNRTRQLDTVGRLLPSVVAMRVLALPSPASSKAAAPGTTRYGAVALCAQVARVFRSPRLNGHGAAGWFIPGGILRGTLNANMSLGHTNFTKSNCKQPANRINGLRCLFVQLLMKTFSITSRQTTSPTCCSLERKRSATADPWRANSRTAAAPMPRAVPVTRATCEDGKFCRPSQRTHGAACVRRPAQ